MELDTGVQVTIRLIEALLGRGCIVILAGDKKASSKAGGGRLEEYERARAERVFDFTEFWKTKADVSTPEGQRERDMLTGWNGSDRLGQVYFYDYLNRKARSLRHFGSRSGNLELMALLGHTVDYIDPENSFGGSRMKPYNDNKKLHYKRHTIKRPMTFKGILIKLMNHALEVNQAGSRTAFKAVISGYEHNIMDIGKALWQNDLTQGIAGRLLRFGDEKLKPVLIAMLQKEETVAAALGEGASEWFAVEPKYLNVLNPLIFRISRQLKADARTGALVRGWKTRYSGFEGVSGGSLGEIGRILDE